MTIKSLPWAGIGLLSLVFGVSQPLLAMPFDPVPSSFERWLNARRDWPGGQRLSFSRITQCSDQTLPVSPYQAPVFTCLKGDVRYGGSGGPSQVCQLRRVTYYPSNQKVRLWTFNCRKPA
jgi:hypothetical protein